MVPPQQRQAFARKASWFRMLARIAAKKGAAVATTEQEPRLGSDQSDRDRCARSDGPKA